MRRLILMRHGKAEFAGLTGGDRERPLAGRGRLEVLMTANWLKSVGFTPTLALVSRSDRTVETWTCAGAVFSQTRMESRDELYLASVETLLDVLDTAPGAEDTIMLVGHNPGLQELGLRLAADASASDVQVNRLAEAFPTATACVFRMCGLQATVLEAIFEPPGREGGDPRWTFIDRVPGGPA